MAPARLEEESDPITASYDIYLTPTQTDQQIYLLQYPNRSRDRPYNTRAGVCPEALRIKPKSGHLELDVNLNTEYNFNKHQGLRWGDAMRTGRDVQGDGGQATYGLAAGFARARRGGPQAVRVRDAAEREMELGNALGTFYDAEREGKVMRTQTLGGQIPKNESPEETGKPVYFVGAFRGEEVHLSRVAATVQMRPQFHHLDAEDQRNRISASREYAAASAAEGVDTATATNDAEPATRVLRQSYKMSNPKGELESREKQMRQGLQAAAEEQWVPLEYVDEDEDAAYETYRERMFVGDTEKAARLRSGMSVEEFLDAISAPGGGVRRRRRGGRKKEVMDLEGEGDEGVGVGG